MKCWISTLALALPMSCAWADDRADCAAVQGVLLVGKVISGPTFVHGQFLQGVELSHTRILVQADASGTVYDARIDNVFAEDYQKNSRMVPASLSALSSGTHVEICGATYQDSGAPPGIHWTHTDCGSPPQPGKPDGWVKVVSADGSVGPNLEAAGQYCSIFQ